MSAILKNAANKFNMDAIGFTHQFNRLSALELAKIEKRANKAAKGK